MTASDRHLDHLSSMLSQVAIPAQEKTLSREDLKAFYSTISQHRLRIKRTDWRDHRVDAMLWHMPDLKPAGKSALSEYISNRWVTHKEKIMAADVTCQKIITKKDGQPAPADHRFITETKPQTGNRGKKAAAIADHSPGSPVLSMQRCDWFDRFTDWVAAVVTLWK